MDEIMMFPLTDLDGVVEEKSVKVVRNGENNQAMSVSLLKRRRSQHISQLKPLKLSGKHEEARDSTDSGYDSTRECVSPTTSAKEIISPVKAVAEIKCKSSPKLNWQKALRKISSLKDPWEKFFMANLPVERAKRHRYNALRKVWSVDEVNVKMEKEPFNHGAMRECYRVKKLSTFSVSHDWHHAMNYVAKKYMQNVDNSVYFEDVKLQMDAKLWGEEYNRHRPPKKVDIFQICILEFIDRPGQPLYHLEHFIEGDYIKYNSNSGFVDDHMRYTPQAFSHFTFERSGHELIVVDIQGVDDLWTDPQIHTADGLGFGDGNLGVNGMALFFHSHICNSICESLSLSKFDLAPSELQKLAVAHGSQHCKSSAMTVVRGQEEMCISASPLERSNLHAFLMRCRSRTISSTSAISEHSDQLDDDDDSHGSNSHLSVSNRYRTISGHHDNTGSDDDDIPESPASSSLMSPTNSELLSPPIRIARRTRFISESDDTTSADEEEQMRQLMKSHHSRPSCVNTGTLSQLGYGHHDDCILGRIHHSLAIYHEMGRFGSDIDWEAAAYHEKQAAELNVLDAMLTMAKISLGLPHELLANCSLDIDIDTGVTYMLKAAITGDRSAMIYMAEAYLTGNGLGSRQVSYGQAVDWYLRAISASQHENSDDFDATIDHPVYQLQAKVAELYLQGGPDLDKDPQSAADLYNQAAENATNAMKGRLASTYYCKAEEALAMCEEE